MNTTENNKLIAEFMGYKNISKVNHHPIYKIPNLSYDAPDFDNRTLETIDTFSPYFDDMKFNTDWNWLMLVVEEIENKLKIKIDISLHICRIHVNEDYTIVISENMGKIESVYTAVIKFIKWYNLQK